MVRPRPRPRSAIRVARAALALLVAGSLGLAGPLTAARADGDPASDVLVAAPPLFLSVDSGASFAEKTALVRQLETAARHGARLRVAVISTRVDLGSVTALWRRAGTYAEFLGRELSLDYHGELLVVMPSGFGVARNGVPVRTALSGLAPRSGHLIDATEQAVQRLTGVAAGSVSLAPVASGSPTSGPGWWTASAVAVTLLAGAWGASLRARPLTVGRAHRPERGHPAP